MVEWNGEERRTMFNQDFYDKMMEIHSDMKHIGRWTEEHDDHDDIRFNETNKKVDWIMKLVWLGIGGLGMLQVLIQFTK